MNSWDFRRLDSFANVFFSPDEQVINRGGVMGVDPEPRGESSLGVKIHHENSPPVLGERPSQADRGGGLTHTTFLVTQRDNTRGSVGFEHWWLGKFTDRAPGRPRL